MAGFIKSAYLRSQALQNAYRRRRETTPLPTRPPTMADLIVRRSELQLVDHCGPAAVWRLVYSTVGLRKMLATSLTESKSNMHFVWAHRDASDVGLSHPLEVYNDVFFGYVCSSIVATLFPGM